VAGSELRRLHDARKLAADGLTDEVCAVADDKNKASWCQRGKSIEDVPDHRLSG
jgi:hypothetical protein